MTNEVGLSDSLLAFKGTAFELHTQKEMPEKIYRDFGSESDLKNFLGGQAWFAGPTTNRYSSNAARADAYEYRNEIASHLFEYALSFSIEPPAKGAPAIVVNNPQKFLLEIAENIRQTLGRHVHKVSWHKPDYARQFVKNSPAVTHIQNHPKEANEEVNLLIVGLGGRKLSYVEKLTEPGPCNSIEAVKNARDKSSKFSDENEFRIYLNTSDFGKPYSGNALFYLVKHLKLTLPCIGKYCELIE